MATCSSMFIIISLVLQSSRPRWVSYGLSVTWKPVVLHTSRFAYIEVVSATRSWSFCIHRSRFAYIEKKQSSNKHTNRIAIGQRNKLNLNPAIWACCCYVAGVIFSLCLLQAITKIMLTKEKKQHWKLHVGK